MLRFLQQYDMIIHTLGGSYTLMVVWFVTYCLCYLLVKKGSPTSWLQVTWCQLISMAPHVRFFYFVPSLLSIYEVYSQYLSFTTPPIIRVSYQLLDVI